MNIPARSFNRSGGALVPVLVLILLSVLGYFGFREYQNRQVISRLDKSYQAVMATMTVEQVDSLMNHPGQPKASGWQPAWDKQPLSLLHSRDIVSAKTYTAPSLITPVTFEFQFTKDNTVVGKRRYNGN